MTLKFSFFLLYIISLYYLFYYTYLVEVEYEQTKLNKVPDKSLIDKTSLGIFQIALRSELNTKAINNYNTAISLEDLEGIDKALEHLTDFITNTAKSIFNQKKTLNSGKKKTE